MKNNILKFPTSAATAAKRDSRGSADVREMPRAVTLTARIRHDEDVFEVKAK